MRAPSMTAFLLFFVAAGAPAQEVPRWTVEPSRRIGVALGDPDYELDEVMGAVRLRDGSIVVGEMRTQEIRFFAPDGRLARRQGRDGEGPGEYRQVRFLLSCGADRIWVYDTALRRLTVLGSDGAVHAIHAGPTPDGTSGPYDLECDDRGRFIAASWAQGAHEAIMSGRSGPFRGTQLVVLTDGTGTVRDTVGVFPSGERYLFLRPDGSPGGTGPRRLGPETHVAIGRSRAFVGDAATPQVYVYEGRTLDTIPLPVEAPEVSPGDLDRLLEARLAEASDEAARRRIRQWQAEYDYPDRYPHYSDLKVDQAGLLWVREYPRPGEVEVDWLVVHPAGGPVARVRLPVGLQVTQIGGDYVLGILEVEAVQVIQEYRLLRR